MTMIFTPVRFSATSVLGGSVSFSIKIPGGFNSIFPTDPTKGRFLLEARIVADNPIDGDYVKDLKLVDTDSLIGAGEQALLPNYPDVVRFYDDSDKDNGNGIWFMNDKPLVITPFPQETPSLSPARFMPGGIYLSGTFVTGGLSLGKTFRGSLLWARWVNP